MTVAMAIALVAPVGAAQEGRTAAPITPFPGEAQAIPQSTATRSSLPSLATTTAGAPGIPGAADWLLAQQDATGWFPWTPGGGGTPNTQGPTARGLLKAYQRTGDSDHRDGAVANGDYLVSSYPSVYTDGDPRFATHDPLFLKELTLDTGDPTYADFLKTYFWDKLAAGTYGEANDMDAADFGAAVVNGRSIQGIVEISPWDLSATAIAAHLAGETATRDALMAAILDGLEATTAAGGYDVIGLTGAVWASAVTGVDLDPTAGVYASADSTADLAVLLAGMTTTADDGAWLYSSTADPDDYSNGDVQTTAYAILALNALDRDAYYGQIVHGAQFIHSLQQSSGEYLVYPGAAPGTAGCVEVQGEAIAALVTVLPFDLFVDDDGVCGGNVPCYYHIQDSVNAAFPGDTIKVYAGTYGSRQYTSPTPPHWSTPNDQWAPALIVYKAGLMIEALDSDPSQTVIQSTHDVWSNPVAIQASTGGTWDGSQYVGAGVNPTGGTAPNGVAIIADDITLDGFTIISTYGGDPDAPNNYPNTAGVFIGGLFAGDQDRHGISGTTVKNCVVSGHTGVRLWKAVHTTVENSTIDNNTVPVNMARVQSAVEVWDGWCDAGWCEGPNVGSTDLRVLNNQITSYNGGHAIALGGYYFGAVDHSDLLIDGNTIDSSGHGLRLWSSAGTNKVMTCNNTVTAAGDLVRIDSPDSTFDGPFPNCAPTAVTLASFTARPGVCSVSLEWQTATEVDNAGFNVYRATAEDGPYTRVNGALVAAEGGPVSGASYSFLDKGLSPGTYFYKLEDVDLSGVATLHGPVQAAVRPRFRRPSYRPTLP